ncbi:butyrate kinase [candidate division KSB1 bacterium]|nr:butyrate kinase [candidate division KSB1 bacterium]
MKKILAINPGSTSTKIALFERSRAIVQTNITLTTLDLQQHPDLWDQFGLRKQSILSFLETHNILLSDLEAVVGRGGLLKPIPGGTYIVSESMVTDARRGIQGQHASNLGCALASDIAQAAGVTAYTVDPVCVDEFEPLARYSGYPLIERRALSHALNIHAVGHKAAEKLGIAYQTSNFVVTHLGGGISICALRNGRIIDVNDASSDGPFTPERTGSLPMQPFIGLACSGEYSEQDLRKLVMGNGGLVAYLRTNDAREVEQRIKDGDSQAAEIYEAMAYQIAKEIGAMSTVLLGKVNGIVITGGLAQSTMLINWIQNRVHFIADVLVFPGEFEMEALAAGVVRVLEGIEQVRTY